MSAHTVTSRLSIWGIPKHCTTHKLWNFIDRIHHPQRNRNNAHRTKNDYQPTDDCTLSRLWGEYFNTENTHSPYICMALKLTEGVSRSPVSSWKLISTLSCRWEGIRREVKRINDTTPPQFSICARAQSDRHLACVCQRVCVYWFNVCLAFSERWH